MKDEKPFGYFVTILLIEPYNKKKETVKWTVCYSSHKSGIEGNFVQNQNWKTNNTIKKQGLTLPGIKGTPEQWGKGAYYHITKNNSRLLTEADGMEMWTWYSMYDNDRRDVCQVILWGVYPSGIKQVKNSGKDK